MGSNPIRVTIYFYDGRLAQLGERLPYKQDVSSSILLSPTIDDYSHPFRGGFFVYKINFFFYC